MKRRAFISALGGAAAIAAWPPATRAQQAGKVRRIGFVAGGARPVPFESGPYIGFLQGMRELGLVEGKDFVVEWRFAEGRYELFPDFAAEFARLGIDVIVTGLSNAVSAMRQVNPDTPIVMGYSSDPVGLGYVASLARPGGNTTGLASALEDSSAKQVDLLKTAVPSLSRLAALSNSANSSNVVSVAGITSAVKQAGMDVLPLQARDAQGIERAFEIMAREHIDALVVVSDALFFASRQRIAVLALEHRLPSMFANREYVQAGGMMSYGDSLQEFYRRAASYVHKILKGAKPADLPIERPTKFNLVINRKTADTLGIAIPPVLYIFADEVIE
jgi:putative ABC transport system substrate-binding protein